MGPHKVSYKNLTPNHTSGAEDLQPWYKRSERIKMKGTKSLNPTCPGFGIRGTAEMLVAIIPNSAKAKGIRSMQTYTADITRSQGNFRVVFRKESQQISRKEKLGENDRGKKKKGRWVRKS